MPRTSHRAHSTSLATYSGASSDPIFVAWDNNNLNPDGAQLSGYNPIGFTLDGLQLNVFGNGTDAAGRKSDGVGLPGLLRLTDMPDGLV